jgi:hypothetical protein
MRDVLQWRGIPELPIVLAAVVAVYASSLNAYFHADDFVAFVDITTKSTYEHLGDVFTFQDTNFYWRPLGQVYYRAIYEVFGLDAWVFRACNLVVFLVTLVLLHRFCLNAGLSRAAAIAAVVVLGLFPNHVVSVAWITNAPRLLATMFFLLSMLALQRGLSRNSLRFEGLAFACFVAAFLSDEVSIALAPVPLVYAFLLHPESRRPLHTGVRALALGAVVAVLLPLQFSNTMDDEPRLASYGLSEEVLDEVWALSAQLSLPLTDSNPSDVPLVRIPDEQWAAGAATLAVAGVLLVFGSPLMRLLVIWLACALAPFMLWDRDALGPRYVYMAAVPFSVLASQLLFSLVEHMQGRRLVRAASLALAGIVVVAAAGFGAVHTYERNNDWEQFTARYELLATGLRETYPELPPGSRVVIYNGIWNIFYKWPEVVVQATYGDASISVVSVPADRVPAAKASARPGDIVVVYADGHFSKTSAAQ